MGMIGNQPAAGVGSISIANDSFNGTGSATSFTLSQTVSVTTDIEVIVDNVQQSPYDGSYSVSGTTLTFSGAPSAGTNNIYVIYNHARTITTNQIIPDDGSVTHSKLHTAALNPITLDPSNNFIGVNKSTGINAGVHIATSDYKALTMEGPRPTVFYKETDGTANQNFQVRVEGGTYRIQQQNDAQSNASDKFRLTQEGYVTTPSQPAFRVGKTTSQTSSGGSYMDPVTFQQTDFNIGNHFSTSTSKFTAPIAGRYIFSWSVSINRNSAAWTGVYSYVNGSYLDWSNSFQYSAPSWFPHDACIIVNLAANDTFHIVGRQDSNATIDNSGWFAGYLLG